MPPINSVDDLPDWFDINDYKKCDSFEAKEWGIQLYARRHEHILARASQFVRSNPDMFNIDTALTQISQGCIRDATDDYRIAVERNSALYSPEGGEMDFHGCVRPALFDEIADIDESAPANRMVHGLLAYDEVKPVGGRAILEVNLDVPDSALIDKFAEVVSKYRKMGNRASPGKKASDATINRLREYKVLAYLDLTHWEALSGTPIHAEVKARALFPDWIRDGRFIRETLSRRANDYMEPGFISTLLA